MKLFTKYCLLLTLLMRVLILPAQEFTVTDHPEKISAVTDRTMYAAGEKVMFSASVYGTDKNDVSRVLYCELITPDGRSMASGKYAVTEHLSPGCIAIPSDASTGIYYLRFYTRMMRNDGPEAFTYLMLKIINVEKQAVISGTEKSSSGNRELTKESGDSSFQITINKDVFRRREEVTAVIRRNSASDTSEHIAVSVVPLNTFSYTATIAGKSENNSDHEPLIKETRGISLSGIVRNRNSKEALPGTSVFLTIPGTNDINTTVTGNDGRFYFALPGLYGSSDIFISPKDTSSEIFIDNDYSTRRPVLPFPPFILNEDEEKAAYNLAVNTIINRTLKHDSLNTVNDVIAPSASFYGIPSETFNLDNYVELGSIQEYFSELSGMVKIRKIGGKNKFVIYKNGAQEPVYDPLVLIDFAAIDDADKILAVSPREIQRIEIINQPYVKGNITFSGIISFISGKNDFAGIDLPSAGTFISYGFYNNCTQDTSKVPSAHFPDTRNTLLWDPDLKLNNGASEIKFNCPDTEGTYEIILQTYGNKKIRIKRFLFRCADHEMNW